ncbi:hypothetical protein NDN08_006909 [Rhodosorus marinus]|uniref:Uncharacterized protein n=1 Tax=Rhodosorus marinus TaxID=101924 RepID=A0AAV8UM40_9RHOD|nr:hypothetical protein NDN08_006909 [Rhodosorus marinus]
MRSLCLLSFVLFIGLSVGLTDVRRRGVLRLFEEVPETSFFGAYVSIWQNSMVAAYYGDNNFVGAVRVYEIVNGAWMLKQKLSAPDGRPGDNFGWQADIRGNRIIVGAAFKKIKGVKRGKAYLFEKYTDGRWTQVKSWVGIDVQQNDAFGYAVTLGEDEAMVCAEQGLTEESASRKNGAVYIYGGSGGNWVRKQIMRGQNEYDQFGDDLRYAAGVLVVGAPFAESGTPTNTGAVYIYRKNVATDKYVREARLTRPESFTNDNFGTSNAISPNGQLLLVGADRGPGPNDVNQGATYIYRYMNQKWQFFQRLGSVDGAAQDRFGYKNVIGPDFLAITAYKHSFGTAAEAGAVYIFRENAQGRWIESQKERMQFPHAGDNLGVTMAANKNWLVVGAPRADIDSNEGNTNDTGLNDGALQLFKIWRPKTTVVFLPRLRTLSNIVKYKYSTNIPGRVAIRLTIYKRGTTTNPVLVRQKPATKEEGFDQVFVNGGGLRRGTVYDLHLTIRMRSNNKVLLKKVNGAVRYVG